MVDPLDDFWELVLDEDDDGMSSRPRWCLLKKKPPQADPAHYSIPEAIEVSLERVMDSVFLPPPPPPEKKPTLFHWPKIASISGDEHALKRTTSTTWRPTAGGGNPKWFTGSLSYDSPDSPEQRIDMQHRWRGNKREILA